MARSCRLPFGTFSADAAGVINLFDVLAHSWDIAVSSEVDLECADELWEIGLRAARTVIGADRDPRHCAPEITVGRTASGREGASTRRGWISPDLNGEFDYIHVFATSAAELDRTLPELKTHLKPTGMLWVSWPKNKQLGTDLGVPSVIRISYDHGLVES